MRQEEAGIDFRIETFEKPASASGEASKMPRARFLHLSFLSFSLSGGVSGPVSAGNLLS
jgi:hypothetical protein